MVLKNWVLPGKLLHYLQPLKQWCLSLSMLVYFEFEAFCSERDPTFLCCMSWLNSWFVLLQPLPHLGILRLFESQKSMGLVTILKGEIVLSLYNPAGEPSRQARCSCCSHQGWVPSSSPTALLSALPGLLMKEDVCLHFHCAMVTHLHQLRCFL